MDSKNSNHADAAGDQTMKRSPELRLKKLSERRDWVNNSLSAKPASWQVLGTDLYIVGRAGGMGSYYSLKRGGEWKDGEHVGGQVLEREVRSFKWAKRYAAAALEAAKQ